MRQQHVNLTHLLRRQPRQHVFHIGIRIMPIEPCDWIKLMIAAARLPLRKEPANSQFERPMVYGRIWFSARLLSMGTAPSSR